MKSLGKFPDSYMAEIAGQPGALRRAAGSLAAQAAILAEIGERGRRCSALVFTGMGSSYFACHAAVTHLGQRGTLALMADAAEMLHFRRPALGPGALLLAVSQSGESAEVVSLVRALAQEGSPGAGTFVVAVTNGTENSLARVAHLGVDTRAGEEIGPSTMTFAASLVALAALARVLAGEGVEPAIERTAAAAEDAAAAVERLLDEPEARAASLARWLDGREALAILGRGTARPAAEMGALTLKEAARFPAESLQSAQFRHGPLELVGPGFAAVVLATEPATRDLDLGLA
ncbi:MAG TPA: SIS domain-containing protein, partial [Actinomycetota bacterium]|nr:SIS domain-containing protein [Actinomycetota bacterium]